MNPLPQQGHLGQEGSGPRNSRRNNAGNFARLVEGTAYRFKKLPRHTDQMSENERQRRSAEGGQRNSAWPAGPPAPTTAGSHLRPRRPEGTGAAFFEC